MNTHASLSRLLVCDLGSGHCLFDKPWRESEADNAPAVVRLIQVFFQFAREMKEGEMTQVAFGPPEALSTRSELASRMGAIAGRSGSFNLSGTGTGRGHGRRRSRQKTGSSFSKRDPETCLTFDKDDSLVAALFHDHDLEVSIARTLCTSVLNAFRQEYHDKIGPILDILKGLPPDEPSLPDDVAEQVSVTFGSFNVDMVMGIAQPAAEISVSPVISDSIEMTCVELSVPPVLPT